MLMSCCSWHTMCWCAGVWQHVLLCWPCLPKYALHVCFLRCSNWEDGAYSRVELRFEEPDRGNTIVTLKQVRGARGCMAAWGQGCCSGQWGSGQQTTERL